MTELEIKRRFRKAGWRIVSGAKHDKAVNPVTGQTIAIPRHKGDVPIGTAHKILREAGLE